MKNLNFQLRKLCRENRDGSYSTQSNRARLLELIANQLHELGYKDMWAKSLKPKHVEALVKHWFKKGVTKGTIKNRMTALRWWARKVGRRSVVGNANSFYGIGSRTYVAKISKAQTLNNTQICQIRDEYVRLSVRLQAAFGLRREESIKFSPSYAIQDDHIRLKASWTKGGRERTVPITNYEQRRLLQHVKEVAEGGSLISPALDYVQQLHRYERQLRTAGLSKLHGLRHDYAQRRYEELTGWRAPVAGGPATKSLTTDQRALDLKARVVISQELGHSREAITAVYLGR